ncbi:MULTISPECIES: DUF1192 domain-containing protein [Sphingomonas]|uniref:DUF1192 domain-containing protein n=1 Tax=Sphingomonas kyungheensis TaxID=1069987 RepID=A0ABU8H6J1_9SPHN|nr:MULTISPECIES: DUF1192 domain-containing protein [unclassified Sphingomonas]EZP55832.1 hypothetical protein BW41_00912 [Sphingomonas sp. RIT328]
MESDDAPSRPNDALTELLRQDLDPLSIAELDARIVTLEAEIRRTRLARDRSVDHRASADALFRR